MSSTCQHYARHRGYKNELIIVLEQFSKSDPLFFLLFNKETNNNKGNIRLEQSSRESIDMKELGKWLVPNECYFILPSV